MICPNCGKENKNTNIRCEFCSAQLIDIDEVNQPEIFASDSSNVETKEIKISTKKIGCFSNILIFLFIVPWLLVGIVFLGIGLFFSISEHNQTKGYEKTTAIFKDYANCTYDDGNELCEAVYEYQVNGITYSVSTSFLSNRGGFDDTSIVYYNPTIPSESVVYESWSKLVIVGFVIVSIVIVILILKKIMMKRISKGKNYITMNIDRTN